ncbi:MULTISPECIES: aminotransferase class I/II-fold pyridoxal phosphate-dependent enzyme [Pseudanabaena]|uniref:Aminotransferase class V-fold PLP-dependent enzyme n=1 Tax=Pseudanabaena catenata USMAC16 TaxID=1855837 RepID=A0A9X4RG74_9CYAN|nr:MULTISPECIES: aminotransferase class I/II-fold pyridoxal phosphate-dependent enzyme [Pseudanabaena]MDG3493171.1 aminotransferase class V-fold PLP-dependent enzyme [Pseudanabaena catenata USMAC16]
MNQNSVPLLEAARRYLSIDHAAFYTPGHKRSRGINHELLELFGKSVFQLDLPELPEIEEAIADAEILAATAYGSDRTWFLTNGSTCGVQAMLLATCQEGDKVLIGRNCHKSAIAALVLTGAEPIYLPTEYLPEFDLDLGVSPTTLDLFLQKHPDTKAVLLVSPNYFGVCGELAKMAAIVHAKNIPLLVDAAHGAHLGFHGDLPISALQAGADLVVQSTHKVAGSLTQSSMLHVKGDRIAIDRIDRALQILRSSSPNLFLMISLDVARRQMAIEGRELLTETLRLSNEARSQLSKLPSLRTLSQAEVSTLDPTRLTVMVDRLGITGFEADALFHSQLGVMAEMPTLSQLVFILSLGNHQADVDRLVLAFQQLPSHIKEPSFRTDRQFSPISMPIPRLTPRVAYFAQSERLDLPQAIGRISAESLCPYPPGIPLICIGEEITAETVNLLQAIARSGGIVNGASDASLATIRVVK